MYAFYTDDGVPIIQSGPATGRDQVFYATHVGSNYYTFKNYNKYAKENKRVLIKNTKYFRSGKYIDVSYLGDVATILQNTQSSADQQKWLVASHNGHYTLTNKASGYVITPQNCGDKANFITIAHGFEDYCQSWDFVACTAC